MRGICFYILNKIFGHRDDIFLVLSLHEGRAVRYLVEIHKFTYIMQNVIAKPNIFV